MDRQLLESLRRLVADPSWDEGFVRFMQIELASTTSQIMRSQNERPEPKFSDEFLRGYARGITYAMTAAPSRVKEYDRLAVEAENAKKREQGGDQDGTGSPYGDDESP